MRDKAALSALLDDAAEQALAYCAASGIGLREVLGHGKVRVVAALAYLRGVTEALVEQLDIDKVTQRVAELLDERHVRSAVAAVLDRELPQESYDRVLFQT